MSVFACDCSGPGVGPGGGAAEECVRQYYQVKDRLKSWPCDKRRKEIQLEPEFQLKASVVGVIIFKYISGIKRPRWAWYVCIYKSMYTLVSFCCSILHARLHSSQPVCRHRNTGQLSEYPPADSGTPPPFPAWLAISAPIAFLSSSLVLVFPISHVTCLKAWFSAADAAFLWIYTWSMLVSEEGPLTLGSSGKLRSQKSSLASDFRRLT